MVYVKEDYSLKSEYFINNKNAIKVYFEKLNALCSTDDKVYQYEYEQQYGCERIKICILFDICEINLRIKMSVHTYDNDSFSEFDIEHLLDHIYANMFKIIAFGDKHYLIRVYGRYYMENVIDFNMCIKWGDSTVYIKSKDYRNSYNSNFDVRKYTSCLTEQIYFCDIAVNAVNLTLARALAFNIFKIISCFLSVLTDVGYEEYSTIDNILLLDARKNDAMVEFINTNGFNGIYDQELDLFVFDNLNGLLPINHNTIDYNAMVSFMVEQHNFSVTNKNDSLEKIFINRKLPKNREKNIATCNLIDDKISYVNIKRYLQPNANTFFRRLSKLRLKGDKYDIFLRACIMYNYSHVLGKNNPTVSIAYLVSSLETLSKIEENNINGDAAKFYSFCKKYADEEYDEKFAKFLYGKIRSGHFHAGETFFLEYSNILDVSMESDFFKMERTWIKAREFIRKIYIAWINKNIMNDSK